MAIYLNNILNPFGGINIASFYLNYYSFIDGLVFLILFLSVAQVVFKKVYKDNQKEAKMVAIAIALALTISMIVLEMNTGFNIGQLAPVSLMVFLIVLAVLLYNLMLGLFPLKEGQKVSMHSAALTYLIIYGLLVVPFGTLYKWIQTNAPILSAVLELAGLVAFVYIIIELFSVLGLGGKSKDAAPEEKDPKKPEEKDPEKPEKKPKPEPEYPDELKGVIGNEYASSIDILVNKFKEYAERFNQIIQAHYDAAGNPDKEPDADMWISLVELKKHMTQATDNANNILDAIRKQDDYTKLNSTDIATLNEIMARHGAITGIIVDYEITARNKYNKKEAPQAIPKTP